jgi:hypothetical protein
MNLFLREICVFILLDFSSVFFRKHVQLYVEGQLRITSFCSSPVSSSLSSLELGWRQ